MIQSQKTSKKRNMGKIKFILAALLFVSLFSACSSSDSDEVPRHTLESYVVQGCAYEKEAFRGTNFRNRAEIEAFLEAYAKAYYYEFSEELDWEVDPLVTLLRSYDSRFFRDRGLIVKCFSNSADLDYIIEGVGVDTETDLLNIDLTTQVLSHKKEYAYIIVECTLSDLKRDVVWNLDFQYYE